MDMRTATMQDLRRESGRLLGSIVIETAKIKTATVNIENYEYQHTEICAELLRRTDDEKIPSLAESR